MVVCGGPGEPVPPHFLVLVFARRRMERLGCGASKELAWAGSAQVASNINAYFLFERWDGQ